MSIVSFLLNHARRLLMACILLAASGAAGQNLEALVSKANHHFHKKHYAEAIPLYLKVAGAGAGKYTDYIAEDELNYALAYSYFYTDTAKEKSILYFEKLISLADTVYEPHFLLGQMYQFTHQYNKALEQFQVFKKLVDADSVTDKELLAKVKRTLNRQLASCNYGLALMASPIRAYSQNLGDTLNTIHSEYAPAITTMEEKMVFTRRSPQTTGGKIAPDGDYFEDIYICDILEGRLMHRFDFDSSLQTGYTNLLARMKFSPPVALGPSINSEGHEGGVTFSNDAKKLFIYKELKVWETEEKDGAWQAPHEMSGLSGLLNKQSYEPSISLSADENTVYLSCEQPGGYGGLDLYRSVKQNGQWGPLENLGPLINTAEDEDSPYIDPDGRHLYFSSKGHSSMGGYDIFRAEFDGRNWSVPGNLGYPVNSAGDDIFFVMPLRYNRGYYSSNKIGGLGKMDLYRVTFADLRPTFAEVRGLVLKGDKFVPTYSSLSILDPFTKEKLMRYESDSTKGDYLMLVGHGKNVLVRVETPGFAPVEKVFSIPPQVAFFQFYQEIHHIHIRDKNGNIIGQMISMLSTEYTSRLIDSLRENDGKLGEKFLAYLSSLDPADSTYKNLMLDVKFYHSEDSIMQLVRKDSTIRTSYPPNTEIAFADRGKYVSGQSETLPLAYTRLKNYTVDKKNKFILFRNGVTLDTLEKIMTADGKLPVKGKPPAIADVPVIAILFDFESAELKEEFTDELDAFVAFMAAHKNYQFEISGHTDSKGDDQYNLNLSRLRAAAVKKYMVSKGISGARLRTAGKGEKEPIAPNEQVDGSDNPDGRQANRRIQFRVIKQ
jgi:outer membrane protein OmpA-like peptidoglycan-associated protein